MIKNNEIWIIIKVKINNKCLTRLYYFFFFKLYIKTLLFITVSFKFEDALTLFKKIKI